MFTKIKKSLGNINYKLLFALLIMGLCPTIYNTIRVFWLGEIPGEYSYSIAGQLSWVSLIYEIINEAIILPLFYFMGQVLLNKKAFTNRVKTGLIITLFTYLILSIFVIIFTKPLLELMATSKDILDLSVDYIRLEAIANIFSILVNFVLVALTTLGKDKYVYFITLIKLLLSVVLDIFLISNFKVSLSLGVNGIAISNIIINVVILAVVIVLLYKSDINIFSKEKLDFNWSKSLFKIGGISGLESFVRNIFYIVMISRMVNVVGEQGTYWVANNFIWGWLLLPIIQLGELIKQEISTNKDAIKKNTLGYITITALICLLWLICIPLYKPFMQYVFNYDDVDKLFNLVMILIGSYVLYAFQNIFDSTFYGLGKTNYMLFESIVTNIIYYGICFILYITNVFQPSLIGIALMFGIGNAFDSIVSFIAYVLLLRKMKIKIFNFKIKKSILKRIITFNILIILCLFSLIYSKNIFTLNIIDEFKDYIGVALQVIVSLVTCMLSILCISISIKNEKIYGISMVELNKIREEFYSVSKIIFYSSLFIVGAVVFYVIKIYLLCISFLFACIYFCIVVCKSEIPIMCNNKKSIFKVLKKILRKNCSSGDLKIEFKKIIKNIITTDETIKTLYFELNHKKDKEFNKQLLILLIELNHDYALELQNLNINDKPKIAERLIKNTMELLWSKDDFDIFNITDNEIVNYTHYFTIIIFQTVKVKSVKNEIMNKIFGILPFIDSIENKRIVEFYASILINIISCSISNANLTFAIEFKKICSTWKYSLSKGKIMNIIFSIVSIHLYYLYTNGRYVSGDYKNKIKRFISNDPIIDHIKTESWSNLFMTSNQIFNLNFYDFMKFFERNENNWDMKIFDSQAHFVVINKSYGITWFLANLFFSHSSWDYNFESLLKEERYNPYVINVCNDILKNPKKIKEMKDMINFFSDRISFKIDLNSTQYSSFCNFVELINRKEIEKQIKKSELVDTHKLEDEYKNCLNNLFESDCFYSKDIEIITDNTFEIQVEIEKNSLACNYNEVICDYLYDNVSSLIIKMLDVKKINIKELEKKFNDENTKKIYVNSFSNYIVENLIKNNNIKPKIIVEKFKSSILYDNYIIIDEKCKFNVFSEITISKLSKDLIIDKVESYKMKDGRYNYEGVFLSRIEIEDAVEKQFAILSLKIKIEVENNGQVYLIVDDNYKK